MYYNIDEIKQISLFEVIPLYLTGKSRNSKYNTLFEKCPFCTHKWHFQITQNGKLYNSFNACCKGGTIIDFIMEIEGLDFQKSIKFLGDKFRLNPGQYKKTSSKEKEFLHKFRISEEKRIEKEINLFFNFIKFISDDDLFFKSLEISERKDKSEILHFVYYCKGVGIYE